jgi:hypothetical protein
MYAFKRGAIVWLWSLLWGVVGTVIALAMSGGSIVALILNPPSATSTWSFGAAFVGMFAGILVGSLVAAIGNYATIVKITLESVEQTQKPPERQQPPPQ